MAYGSPSHKSEKKELREPLPPRKEFKIEGRIVQPMDAPTTEQEVLFDPPTRPEKMKKELSAIKQVVDPMASTTQTMMSNMPPQPSNVMGVAQPVFNPSSMAAANNMFGSMQMRQNAVGAPPVFKKSCGPLKQRNLGNYGGYEKTNVGDLIDESIHDETKYKVSGGGLTSGKNYNVQDLSEIQKDDKGQFMTTLADDEYFGGPRRPGVERDTLRPATGKYFYKPKK